MGDLSAFRDRVRSARRSVGRTQQQLAREIGLHPNVLSHKLNGSAGTVLNSREALAIVTTLAGWGGIDSRRDAEDLLDLAAVSPAVVAAQAWEKSPLGDLRTKASPADPPAGTPAEEPAATPAATPAGSGLWWTDEHVPTLRPGPMPQPTTPLIGRTEELETVLGLLRRNRLLTLLGAGGTGKTRLALRVAELAAEDFPDGVAFADLAPLTSPELIAETILRSLGLAPDAGGAADQQLLAALRHARLLIVVDNIEHLAAGAGLLGELLSASPHLHLLVTSRVVLRLYGEQQFRVWPLPLPDDISVTSPAAIRASDAIELFCQRARAVRPQFDPVGAELTAVADICRLLGGLPLALELAAARIRTFSPLVVLERLQDQHSWLGTGARDRPRRQQSLASALAWSEALLSPEQRRLFIHLGVFAGSFDAHGPAAVVDQPTDQVLDLLIELEEHSLLELADAAGAITEPRFRLLEPIREYAVERLREVADVDAVRRAHLRHYRRAAQAMGPPRPGADADPELYRLFLDQANIRAALDWATAQAVVDRQCLLDGLRLVTACGRMWSRRSLLAEGMVFLRRLLDIEARSRSAPPELRAAALVLGAAFSCMSNDITRTRELAGEALGLCEEIDDPRAATRAHRLLGEVALAADDLDDAMAHFHQQLEFARRTDDPGLTGDALNMLGQGYTRLGRFTEARTALLASMSDFEISGDADVLGAVIGSLAELSYRAGDLDESADHWVAGLRLHIQTRTYRGVAYGLEGCATVEAARGRARTALEFVAAAQRIRDAGGWILPEPERRVLLAALAEPAAALTDDERRRAIAKGRDRDLDAVVADAIAIATPAALPAPATH